jgi:hypothetical protein
LLVTASGCDEGVTEIVVVVDTDMDVPADIERVDVVAIRGGDTERLASRSLDGATVPTVAVLRHEGGPLGPVEVTAIGRRGGAEVVSNEAAVSFVAGEQIVLELPLVGSCRSRMCGANETCDHTGCRPIARSGLAEWDGTVPRIPRDDCEASCPDGRCRDGVCCTGCFVPAADGRSFECREGTATTACGRGGVDCASCDCTASDACVDGACAQEGTFTDADPGDAHSCAVGGDGRVYCWGSGGLGRLGVIGSEASRIGVPTPISSDERFVTVATGYAHACAVSIAGALHCWGNFSPGTTASAAPVLIDDTRRWIAITAGRDCTCGVTRPAGETDGGAAGELWCFGAPDSALGRPGASGAEARVPGPVDTAVADWIAVEAGSSHACAVRANGELYCWGENDFCEISSPASADVLRPALVREGVREVSAGERITCAVGTDGIAWCWGRNVDGETGTAPEPTDGGPAPPTCDPVAVGSADMIERIAAGDREVYALRAGGVVWRWPPLPPEPASPAADFMSGWGSIEGDDQTWCVMRGTALYCWGRNDNLQVGIGDVTGHPATPQRVCLR